MRRPSTTPFEEAEMNLTPLIDVVFIVLIIFIIIAPILELDRVELATSSITKEQSSTPDSSSLAIYVKHDNTIWFQGKSVTPSELTSLLKPLRRSSKTPQLFQDRRAFFGTYQTAKNAIEDAGYDQLDVILKPN